MSSQTITCQSCGNHFSGGYCNACGEKVINQEDRKLKHLFSEVFNSFTFADSKLWYTLKVMLISPGRFVNDYVEGRRLRYMKPVALFFMANLIYFLFPLVNTFTTNLHIQLQAFVYSGLAENMVNGFLATSSLTYEEFELLYDTKTASLSKILLIFFVLILALFFAPIHYRSKRKLMADHIAINLELMSYVLLITIEVTAIFLSLIIYFTQWEFILTNNYLSVISLLLLTWYFFKMEKHFYGFNGIRRIINIILCLTSVVITIIIYRGLLFFITFWSIT